MAPRGSGKGKAHQLVGTGPTSSRVLPAATTSMEGSTPRELCRNRGSGSAGMNGSNSTHPSASAANIGDSTPTSDSAVNSHVADTTSTNVHGLIRTSVSRGVLRPSHTASGSITSAFKRSLLPGGFAWSLVPTSKRKEYFEEFRKEYTWDPAIERSIEKAWLKKAGIRYKDMVHDFKEMWEAGKKPPFITDDEWENWKAYWQREDVVLKSEKARANRMSEPEGPGTGHILHRGGSRSAQEYAIKLSEELNIPEDKIDWEVFLRFHYKNGHYTDVKSKKIADEVYRIAEEERQPLPDTTEEREVDMNAIYLRVAKALEKKNTLFGQGCRYTTAAQSSSLGEASSDLSRAAMEEQLSTLQFQLTAEREERMQSETKQAELQEQVQKQAEEQTRMKAQLEHIMRHWSGPPPS